MFWLRGLLPHYFFHLRPQMGIENLSHIIIRRKLMANKTDCPASGCCIGDVVGKVLCKIGITRSCLITLALVPFAWDGVMWFGHAVQALWNAATTAVGQ
jgi:hypothetical protein